MTASKEKIKWTLSAMFTLVLNHIMSATVLAAKALALSLKDYGWVGRPLQNLGICDGKCHALVAECGAVRKSNNV
jgi:hypothetical protein